MTKVEGSYENGDLVDVVTPKGKYLGTGFVNDTSKIRVRIISTNTNDKFDEAFWERRLRYALDYRLTVMGEQDFKCWMAAARSALSLRRQIKFCIFSHMYLSKLNIFYLRRLACLQGQHSKARRRAAARTRRTPRIDK